MAEPGATPAAGPLDVAADRRAEAHTGTAAAGTAMPDPSHDEIAAAAYQRYQQRGGQHGSDWDDWLEAERSLRKK